ncbi:hypothetical protein [Vibrio mangrovi]|uniref:Uncharacterized protein n=1 Tax=Vibrio mangrovi TaxID=474394 RepID=A0A1Y6IUY0_9VIBR|nr:hypothetical protein [Vibrio mangrovi]MDW6001348.1 hypothetical protein [Vibrio mangrovi]SMS00630.1 hypothetical protein VIM7927_01897 [Vibrio mangrovi]
MNNIIRFLSGSYEKHPYVCMRQRKILLISGIISLVSLFTSFNTQAFVSKNDIEPSHSFDSEKISQANNNISLSSSLTSAGQDITLPYNTSEYTSLHTNLRFKEKQNAFTNLNASDVAVFTIGEAVFAFMAYGAAVGYDDEVGGTQLLVSAFSFDSYSGQRYPIQQYGFAALGAYNLINDVKKERDADGDRKIDEEVFMINFVGMNLIMLGEYANSMFFDDNSNQHFYVYPDNHGNWFFNYRYNF